MFTRLVYFLPLMEKTNKKDQGSRQKAKNLAAKTSGIKH
jgi:hypothetical protein